jgi:hypothetical protein
MVERICALPIIAHRLGFFTVFGQVCGLLNCVTSPPIPSNRLESAIDWAVTLLLVDVPVLKERSLLLLPHAR